MKLFKKIRLSKIACSILIAVTTLAGINAGNFPLNIGKIKTAHAATFSMKKGYYVGTGASLSITGLGFQPNLVMLKADTAAGVGMMAKSSAMPATTTMNIGGITANDTSTMISLDADGFTVSSAANANTSGVRWEWVAFGGSDCTSSGTFCVGTYTGNGASREISTGFQPDLVVTQTSGQQAAFKSSVMDANETNFFDEKAKDTSSQLITTFNATSFGLGTGGSNANWDAHEYYFFAFKEVSGAMDVGEYTGNTSTSRTIDSAVDAGLTFQSNFFFTKNVTNGATYGAATNFDHDNFTNYFTDVAAAGNIVKSLISTGGFITSGSAYANENGSKHYYAAFGGSSAPSTSGTFQMARGSYTGNGTSQSITDLGFQPNLVIVKGNGASYAVFRTSQMVGTTSTYLANATASLSTGITSIDAGGFSVGADASVNTNTTTYHYQAFGNAWTPETNSGAADFAIGMYTGTGVDSRNIYDVPFNPSFVTVKKTVTGAGGTTAVWNTSTIAGDTSNYLTAAAAAANEIQSLGTNSFQVGTSTAVNDVSGTQHYWFAFKNGSNFTNGSYSGTGVEQNITGLGLDPDLVWTKKRTGGTARAGMFLSDSLSDGNSQYFLNTTNAASKITALIADGFTVSTGTEVNENTFTYDYVAWKAAATTPDGVTVGAISGNTTEAGGTATFTVVLDALPSGNVVIDVVSDDTTEGTVSPAALTFTTGNWSTPQTVTVTGVNDNLDDGNINYNISISMDTANTLDSEYDLVNPADVTATNTDNDTSGITVSAISGNTTEAAGTATFTVVLDAQPTDSVSIGISSSDTTEGTVSTGTLTFTTGNWSTPQTVTVTGVNDNLDDGDINYSIVTAAATSNDANYNNINASDVSATNTDNDSSGFTVSAISGNTTEAGGTATFTVVLTAQPTADVSTDVSSSDTTEGTVAPASLTFTAANWSTPQTVTVTGADDVLIDGNIAYSIVLAAATSADGNYNTLNPSDVSVTNEDNDTPGITVGAISGNTTEAGGTATFTVVLDSQPANDVSIGISSNDTTEGTVSADTLTFTNLNWDTPQTITVTGVNDNLDDGNIVYSIVTAASSSVDANYNNINAADVSVTNTDNDTAGITVGAISGDTTEAGATATFTVVLDTQPTANVTIDITSTDTTEDTVSPASLTFTSGNWNTPQTVTATGVDDSLDDGNIVTSITVAAAVSDDVNYNGINPSDVNVTNIDNDTAGFTVTAALGNTTEAGGTTTFTVVLNTQPTADVTVGISSSDTTEGTVAPASLTFTALNWSVAQTVTITGVNDDLDDGNINYSIITAAASSLDGNYNNVNPSDVSVTNTDNDSAGITVGSISGDTSEAGVTATFTVVLNTQPTDDVAIGVSSSDTTEGTVSPATLTFTAANWNTPQTVTVTGVNDNLDDGDIVFSIVLAAATSNDVSYNGTNPADVAVTNDDNDTAGITVGAISGNTAETGTTATFTIVLDTQPTNDVTIGISSSNVAEGTVSAATLTFTAANWNTPQTVTVTGVDESIDDGDTAYNIVIAASESVDANYNAINPADIALTNTDNDTASITVGTLSGNTSEALGTATFTLVLATKPTDSTSIGISSSDTTEGTVSVDSVTFTQLNWDTPQTITITGVDDTTDDNNITYTIVFAASSSTDPNYDSITLDPISVINVDNDETATTTTTTVAPGGPVLISTPSNETYQNQYETSETPIETDDNLGAKVLTQGFNIIKGEVDQTLALTNKREKIAIIFQDNTQITLDDTNKYTGRIFTPDEIVEEKLVPITAPIHEDYKLLKGIDIETGEIHVNLDKPATIITQLPKNTDWHTLTPEKLEIWRFNEITEQWNKIEYPITVNYDKKVVSFEISRFSIIALVEKKTFKDIENHWAKPYILDLVKAGIFRGFMDGNFNPDNFITRAEFIKTALLAFNVNIITGRSPNFKDIDKNHWAKDYLETALHKGWIAPYANGNFNPDAKISRVEAIKIILKITEADLSTAKNYKEVNFNDIDTNAWYMPYIKYAAYHQLISGSNTNIQLRPSDGITRAETAKILHLSRSLNKN